MERKFYIIGQDNTTLDLNDDDLFAYSPSGLGVSIDNTITYVNGIPYNDESVYDTQEITLKVLCMSHTRSPYNNFKKLVTQLRGGAVTLAYSIPEIGMVYRDVVVKSVSKSEMNDNGAIDETIIFEPLSMWYVIEEFTATSFGGTVSGTWMSFVLDGLSLLDISYRSELTITNNTAAAIPAGTYQWEWYNGEAPREGGLVDSYKLTSPLEIGDSIVSSNMTGYQSVNLVSESDSYSILHMQSLYTSGELTCKDGLFTLFVSSPVGGLDVTLKVKKEYSII